VQLPSILLLQMVTQALFAPYSYMALTRTVLISMASLLKLSPVKMVGWSVLISLLTRTRPVRTAIIPLTATNPLGNAHILLSSIWNLPSGRNYISSAQSTTHSPHSRAHVTWILDHRVSAQAPRNRTSFHHWTRFLRFSTRLNGVHLSLIYTTNHLSALHSQRLHVARDQLVQVLRLLLPEN
jgi:hypothetical protein